MQVCPHPSNPAIIAICGEGRLLVLELDSDCEVKFKRDLRDPLIPRDFTMAWLPSCDKFNRVAITTATQITILSTHGDIELPTFTVEDTIVATTFSETNMFILTESGRILLSVMPFDVGLNFALDSYLQVLQVFTGTYSYF